MNIKSLILGSATVALAATGAQAADAIVIAEPEPVEYVRVCDVYGAGFFYIPGTETCLRIGAEIRYQLGTAGSDDGGFASNYYGFTDDTWNSHSRVRLYFDARSETELGLLRGYVRIDSGRTSGATGSLTVPAGGLLPSTVYATSDGTYLNHAWLSLGGFRAGWTDSAWVSTPQGGVAAGGSHSDTGLDYRYQQAHLIQYNFSGSNGFFGTISLEDDNDPTYAPAYFPDRDYIPNVVGVVGVNQAWGAAWLKVGYDANRLGVDPAALPAVVAVDESGFGVTAGLHYNIPGAPGSSFRLIGYYADSDNQYAVGRGALLGTGTEWSVLASYYHQFNAQFGASLAVQYFSDLYVPGTDVNSGVDAFAVELNAVWTPVQNFVVRSEVVYRDIDTPVGVDGSSISGFVRFSRFF